MIKFIKNCICGARWTGTVGNKVGKFLLREWEKEHSGEGHKPCDSKTSYKARSTEHIDWTK